jgi:hypothetical protein
LEAKRNIFLTSWCVSERLASMSVQWNFTYYFQTLLEIL